MLGHGDHVQLVDGRREGEQERMGKKSEEGREKRVCDEKEEEEWKNEEGILVLPMMIWYVIYVPVHVHVAHIFHGFELV